jgi:UDP-glucose 4-epimerase
VLGARRAINVPLAPVSWTAAASWAMRLQPTERGWVDLAAQSPLLSTERIGRELGWQPQRSSTAALAELLEGFGSGAHGQTPPLRSRAGDRWRSR